MLFTFHVSLYLFYWPSFLKSFMAKLPCGQLIVWQKCPRWKCFWETGLWQRHLQQKYLEPVNKYHTFMANVKVHVYFFKYRPIFFFFFKILFIFRERGREGERGWEKQQYFWEKHRSVASRTPLTGDLARNPGTCPDWESNRWPLCLQKINI